MAAHRSGEIGSKRQCRLAGTSQQSCSASRDSSRRVCRHTGYSAEKSRVTTTPAASNRYLALQRANRGIEVTRSKFGCQASRLERLRPYEVREMAQCLFQKYWIKPNVRIGSRAPELSLPESPHDVRLAPIASEFSRHPKCRSAIPGSRGGQLFSISPP